MEIVDEQKRGQLTKRIQDKSKELLGYEIDESELRLMPYLHYQLVNEKKPVNINKEEQDILIKWLNKGYIVNGVTPEKGRIKKSIGEQLEVTKEFWNILNEIIYLGYVDLFEVVIEN